MTNRERTKEQVLELASRTHQVTEQHQSLFRDLLFYGDEHCRSLITRPVCAWLLKKHPNSIAIMDKKSNSKLKPLKIGRSVFYTLGQIQNYAGVKSLKRRKTDNKFDKRMSDEVSR